MTAQKPIVAAIVGASLVVIAGGFAVAAPSSSTVTVAQANRPSAAPAQRRSSGGIADFGGANNNKPINIEADKLEVFQKDERAVYSGNVVATQGETTMKCSQLIVFFDQSKATARDASAAAPAGGQGDALKKLECKGPVSVVAKSEGKTQVATGDNAVYDRLASIVTLTGNVILADGANVTKCGASFTYNTNTGQAICSGGRVQGVFTPGSDDKAKPKPAN